MELIKKGMEYATVNENKDLWIINYDNGAAVYTELITLNDLAVNNEEYINLGEFSIYDYLKSQGYVIDEQGSSETVIEFE